MGVNKLIKFRGIARRGGGYRDLKPYREGYVHGLAMMINCRGWDLFLHATLVQSLPRWIKNYNLHGREGKHPFEKVSF